MKRKILKTTLAILIVSSGVIAFGRNVPASVEGVGPCNVKGKGCIIKYTDGTSSTVMGYVPKK